MLGKGRVDPGEGLCLEWLRQIDPEGLGSQRCAEGAKLRCLCHGRSSAFDDELQPHQAHTAWPMMSSLSRSGNQGSSSVNIVTHCRQEHGIFVMSVPQPFRRIRTFKRPFLWPELYRSPGRVVNSFLLDEKSAVVPVRL